jgi:hypothetical protein
MKKPLLILSCSVTESHFKEFLLLKYSAELFHDCLWYLSCDEYSYNNIPKEVNISSENIGMKNGKVFGDEEEITNFYKVIDGKFAAAKRAIANHGQVLMVDSDIIFCGEFREHFLGTDVDASICPHYQWNPEMDKAWGLYNVGFVNIRNIKFLEAWEEETKSGRHEFEQVPMEIVVRNSYFRCQKLPIQHNMGWWRFNSAEKRVRANSFECLNDGIWFDGNPVSSFHFHSFVDCHHSQPLKDFVFKRLLPNTSSGKQIIEEYNRLKLWSGH